MLEVLPIQSKIEQEAICARCGVSYDENCMAYHALINGVLTGACQFCMDESGGHIRTLALVKDAPVTERDARESLFVMGRATLNFIDLCGVHIAYFEDAAFQDEGIIRAIGFSRGEEDQWVMDLNGFFSEPCKCGK